MRYPNSPQDTGRKTMQSRRDQVQAHGFLMSRLTAGMLTGDSDAPEGPLTRTTRGVTAGLVMGVLLCAGTFVFGLLRPGGNNSWKTPHTLVVNKDTGARFIYVDGALRPVRNYASARLIVGPELSSTSVGSTSLKGIPVGGPVGIPGAPDTVPRLGDLDDAPWRVCIAQGDATEAARHAPGARTSLVVGGESPAEPVGADEGVVVQGPDKQKYLVWQGSRLSLDEKSGAAVSLGYGSVAPLTVTSAFLDALPAGPALAAPTTPGRGTEGPDIDGHRSRLGEVFQAALPGSESAQYYLLHKEGLVAITDTQAAMALGDPRTREDVYGGTSPKVLAIGADILEKELASDGGGRASSTPGAPESPPRPVKVRAGQAACVQVDPGNADRGPRVTAALAPLDALAHIAPGQPGEGVTAACLPVDSVVVQPGGGALVHALSAGGVVGDTVYLVADNGVKYRIPSSEALKDLGYSPNDSESLPSQLLAMLPTGSDLDPMAASGAVKAATTPDGCDPDAQRRSTVGAQSPSATKALGPPGPRETAGSTN
ncbi:type VII secretion protein EccB [Streptomyces sp. NPDC093675]|uniref:type VII secretion protein EccB n=1 Tax=Streptomyces sp. NPDC093675 TaxID=3366049 RepID=UPI0038206AA8